MIIIFFFFISFGPTVVFAHPGRTDAYGCHTCRTNCPNWGLSYEEYHGHRSKGLPQPEEPVKSHLNKSGAGYTEPALDYKIPTKIKSVQETKQSEEIKKNWFRRLLQVFNF